MLRRILIAGATSVVALCAAVGVAQAQSTSGAAPSSTPPAFNVYSTGTGCPAGVTPAATTTDYAAYSEMYTRVSSPLTSYTLGCVGSTSATTVSHTEGRGCTNGAAAKKTKYEDATFADGEQVLVCTVPDVNATGRTRADARKLTFVDQGFRCEATVGTGPTDSTATNIRNTDSIEFEQSYALNKNEKFASITTACVGMVPANRTVAPTPTSNEVACSQNNPFGMGTIGGSFGESITFPDRQYEEICQMPDYSLSGS